MGHITNKILLSIVIPTRERGRYLRHSLNTAIACSDSRIEIVVSDNASEDNTQSILSSKRYKRVKYVRTPERVSVSRNFESAFSNASGQYVLYIGDDDAVLPNGIRDLLEILETKSPDIVSWPQVGYYWPGESANGFLRIKRRHLIGGVKERDPAELMEGVCAGERCDSSFHCGCVSRELVQTITSLAGRYHYYTIPDASAFGALAFAKSYIYLNRPVTVYGRSPASNTTALLTPGSNTYARFAAENACEAGEELLDTRCRSVFAYGLDGLMLTRRLFRLQSPPINFEGWKGRIIQDLISMPAPFRDEQAALVNRWLASNGIAGIDMTSVKSAPAKPASPVPVRKSTQRVSLNSVIIETGPNFVENVDSAVRVAQRLIGPGSLIQRQFWAIAFLRWLGVMAAARRAKRRVASVRRARNGVASAILRS